MEIIGSEFDNLTIMIILDDFTKENGTIECYDKDWKTLYPKSGDIIILNGQLYIGLLKIMYILHYTNGY